MNSIFFIVMRRMRAPLIAVIISFGIAILGMTLMPGVDNDGNPWRMSLFEALYVVSYSATTVGFGELPYAFSTPQRLWMLFSIYLTVSTWVYAIGKIIALVQDPALRQALTLMRFTRAVSALPEPFFILCGYAEAGELVARTLDQKGLRVVVLDLQQARLNELELEDYQFDIPSLCADAKSPDTLLRAGLRHPRCRGVLALTDDDRANLAIAIAAKLMNPAITVLARAENEETAANLRSFNTDHIINPYTLFGEHLAMKLESPDTYRLHTWMTGSHGNTLPSPVRPPIGRWVVCGYGRFGKSVVKNLQRVGMDITIIEADPSLAGELPHVQGAGTEAHTLIKAGIKEAAGVVAGTRNDMNNLSIVMTARGLNPDLFVALRQNRRSNGPLFEQFKAELTMDPNSVIAHDCLAHVVTPLLAQFLVLSRHQDNDWSARLIERLVATVGEATPETWRVTVDGARSPAVFERVTAQQPVTLAHLLCNLQRRDRCSAAVPLMLRRRGEILLLPEDHTALRPGDRVLFCGTHSARERMALPLNNPKVLAEIIDGRAPPDSFIWRWASERLSRRRRQPPGG